MDLFFVSPMIFGQLVVESPLDQLPLNTGNMQFKRMRGWGLSMRIYM